MRANEFQVVKNAIAGHKDVDDKALAALKILKGRLERIRSIGGIFDAVEFSSEASELISNRSFAAVS